MNEPNPYEAPKTDVTPEVVSGELADRVQRFLAALIDGIIAMVVIVPTFIGLGLADLTATEPPSFVENLRNAILGFIIFVALHGYFLKEFGQTIGKKVMGIRIVGLDGRLRPIVDLLLKRYLILTAITLIPLVGFIVALVNVLMIFREDRRCGHDLIANTRVVKV